MLSWELTCQQVKGVYGSVQILILQLQPVVDAVNTYVKIAIDVAVPLLSLFVQRRCATFPSVISCYGQVCPPISTSFPPCAALGRGNACFTPPYMSMTATEGYAPCTPPFFAASTVPHDHGACAWQSPRQVHYSMHTRVNAVPFDSGFAKRNVIDDGTITRNKIQAGKRVKKFRSVYAPFVRNGDAHPTGIDRSDDSSSSTESFPKQTEEAGAPQAAHHIIRYPAALECRLADEREETSICLSNAMDHSKRQVT